MSDDDEWVEVPPTVSLLLSLRAERIDYGLLIGEGIDNAFDAGASSLAIGISKEAVSFQDNGVGITRDRIYSLFRLGEHGAMPTSALGRFGIGIKSQAVNAGDFFEVISVSRDGRVQAAVNWRQMLRAGRFAIRKPKWLPVLAGTPTGTTVMIGDLRPNRLPLSIERLREEIALRFYPALAGAASIVVNDRPVEVLREPAMTDIIDQRIALSAGRTAHIRAGILVAPGKLHHVHVGFKHRVILPSSVLGCGTYGGCNKMFARVQVDGPWHFARFKNDLPDEPERAELDEAVEEVLRPILEKCNTASMSARADTLLDMMNAMLLPEMVAARPRRKGERGSKVPEKRETRSGQVRDPESLDGPATMRRPSNRILITFDGNDEAHGVGYYQSGRVQRINLAGDNPYIAALMAHRDQEMAARSLLATAMMLYEQGRSDVAPELPGINEPFGKRIAKLLTLQDDDSAAATG